MKLKINDDGFAEVVDGKPVYTHDDGSEVPFDVEQHMAKFKSVNDEAKNHRLRAKSLETELNDFKTSFDGIDLDEAKHAIGVVKALDEKDLVKAEEIDKLKRSIEEGLQKEKETLITAHKTQITDLNDKLANAEGTIHQMVLKDAFSNSAYFSGKDAKTLYEPWEAMAVFGRYFKVQGSGIDAKPVGYLNGEMITSRENFVDPAKFDESIAQIISSDQDRFNKILATNGGGGGGGGGDNNSRPSSSLINKGDNAAFMKNIKDIASGKVKVRME